MEGSRIVVNEVLSCKIIVSEFEIDSMFICFFGLY